MHLISAEPTELFVRHLDNDELHRLALTKLAEIVGEAAKHVSHELRAERPNVPWAAAARMRDRLIHHYFDINLDVLWQTVTEDLPRLLDELSTARTRLTTPTHGSWTETSKAGEPGSGTRSSDLNAGRGSDNDTHAAVSLQLRGLVELKRQHKNRIGIVAEGSEIIIPPVEPRLTRA